MKLEWQLWGIGFFHLIIMAKKKIYPSGCTRAKALKTWVSSECKTWSYNNDKRTKKVNTKRVECYNGVKKRKVTKYSLTSIENPLKKGKMHCIVKLAWKAHQLFPFASLTRCYIHWFFFSLQSDRFTSVSFSLLSTKIHQRSKKFHFYFWPIFNLQFLKMALHRISRCDSIFQLSEWT